ncbi:L,D-transpeptidase ErfK/SrfK [Ketogulonicigenium robustum]|uniref:L,D-transpeptidase ErfK/SrfK n=1 Tax=Ketogulonicigenium robustum TaxID=92947 RepID=A0A1W6P2V7_9RHOB|nr:L,D-transpeptidase [Ketogulonicigenium robustum]ARO15670.1 L,D-transpeptidase ErfK/SrfK [Ketogulonicigenium robustum]
MSEDTSRLNRRGFIAAGATLVGAGLASPALAQMVGTTQMESQISQSVQRNISAFHMRDWRPYFTDLRNGAILCDLDSRAVHFWSEDESIYRLYPSSVPLDEELTRRGRTQVIEKRENPTWRPTPSMRQRNPEWPEVVPGGDPMNPLGIRALYLSWQYYRIHGTHDTRKIGRPSSNGCVGLYNEHIIELYNYAKNGTQVYVL